MFERPSGSCCVRPHLRHAADRSRVGDSLRRPGGRDPEAPVRSETVGQHLPVPRLEDVERKRRAGKEDGCEGKSGKPVRTCRNLAWAAGRRDGIEAVPESERPAGLRRALPRHCLASRCSAAITLRTQNPLSDFTSGESRSFSNARSRIWRIRSRVTPSSAPIFSSVRASDPSSRP